MRKTQKDLHGYGGQRKERRHKTLPYAVETESDMKKDRIN